MAGGTTLFTTDELKYDGCWRGGVGIFDRRQMWEEGTEVPHFCCCKKWLLKGYEKSVIGKL